MNNVLILVGRITQPIELKYTPNNKAIINVNLAVNNAKDDTTFISVTCFGKTAEAIEKYCRKGDMIGFNAMVKNHNWKDKQGNTHYDYSFIANKVNFLQSRKEQTPQTTEKKEDNTSIFEQFGKEIEINDEFLD
jgi:single-strand DNA-binding protein